MIAQRFLRPNGCAESGARAALLADLKRLNYDITVAYTSPLHANAAQNWLGLHGIAIHPFCYDAQVDQFIRYNRRRFSEIIAIDRVKGEWADSLCFCHRTHKSPTPLSLRALVSTMTHALPMMQGLAGDPKDHAQNIAVAWVDRTDCDFWRNTIARLTEAHNNQLSARIALSGPGAIELATSLAPNARQHCIFLAPTAHIGALLSRSQFLAVSSDKALWIRQIARAEKVPALILPPDDAKAAILLAHFERSETARKTALALDIPYVAEMTSLKATKARLFSLLTSDRQRDKPIERATTAC